MKRTPHFLAIALVATALSADRAVASAPVVRHPAESVASKIVSRLSQKFRRVVPSVRIAEFRHGATTSISVESVASQPARFDIARLSPLVLHLPPPTA